MTRPHPSLKKRRAPERFLFPPRPARGVCFLGRGRRRADGEMARRHVKKVAFFEMSPYPYDFSGENCFGNSIA